MTQDRVRIVRTIVVMGVILALAVGGIWFMLDSSRREVQGGGAAIQGGDRLEFDKKSKYSHIKVTKNGNTRTLWFVRDNGDEVVETMVNLDRPQDLVIEYTQFMFTSYAFRPKQERVLIVGLGGGSMVHFLKHHDPSLKVDVVDIDPMIVEVADQFFQVKSDGNVKIYAEDGEKFLKNTKELYDVIYMDAFLKPAPDTSIEGIPAHLQTIAFYKETQKKLKPGGLVVFNLNGNPKLDKEMKDIRDAFPQAYEFKLSHESGYVVVGSTTDKRISDADVQKETVGLDQRFRTNFSFRDIGRTLKK